MELESGRPRTSIIALTASALEDDVRRAMEAGCEMHISKPVKKTTLLDAIAKTTASQSVASSAVKAAAALIQPAVDFQN